MEQPLEGGDFARFAPAGYYVALRIGFAFPLFEYNALPERWVEHYTQKGLMLYDPVLRWAYENDGATRWSALSLADPREVMLRARHFGLTYGVVVACDDRSTDGQRSIGSFARSDREFDDGEIVLLEKKLRHLHDIKAPPSNLTKAELEALRMVKDGLLLKEIAAQLVVSEGAVKQRLKNARLKLGARTGSQAVSMALSAGLI